MQKPHFLPKMVLALSIPVIVTSLFSAQVHAVGDWETAGNNIYYSGGNVGVGTANPNILLSLNKATGGFNAGLTQNQFGGTSSLEMVTADSGGNATPRIVVDGATNNANIAFYSGSVSSSVNQVLMTGINGQFGLGKFIGATAGSTTPQGALHIKEGGRTGLVLEDENDISGQRVFRYTVQGGKLKLQALSDNAQTVQRVLMQINHTGDMCIGTGC